MTRTGSRRHRRVARHRRACAVALAEPATASRSATRPTTTAPRRRSAVESAGGDALAVQADVADADAVDSAFGEIEEAFGPGRAAREQRRHHRDGLVARMTDEHWDAVLDTNLTGAFHTIRRATPKMMRARFGPHRQRVVGERPDRQAPGQANYAAAKAGLWA